MQASSSDESFLGPVSCTLGTNLNAKRLTVGSFLTVGLTAHLTLDSTSIFISLKLLLHNNAIAMGGREQWAITVSYNIMPVTHGMMLADSSSIPCSSTLEPQLCQRGKDRGYQLQPVAGTQHLSKEVSEWDDVKSDILIVIPHSGLNRRTLAIKDTFAMPLLSHL